MMKEHELLFRLIRIALGKELHREALPKETLDVWIETLIIAGRLGLSGLCLNAISKMTDDQYPDICSLSPWLVNAVTQEYEYEKRWNVACRLSKLWAQENIKAVVLKGFSFAQYYPDPKYRFSSDLDVFIPEGWERACDMVEEKGIPLSREIYKDTSFSIKNVHVECHRVIRPIRGNKHSLQVEIYLRSLLLGNKNCFANTTLINPSIQFNITLFIDHALGDLLNTSLSFKQLIDWIVLRDQEGIDWKELNDKCKEFKCDRFVSLLNSLADVVLCKSSLNSLPQNHRQVLDEMFSAKKKEQGSFTERRFQQFFNVIKNHRKFRDFGYCSMPSYLFHIVWAHFFQRGVPTEG